MRIAVFGAGYVGLVSGACLASIGHHVTCIDVSRERVDAINAGKTPIYEVGLDAMLADMLAAKRFRATLDAAATLPETDLSMIAVGTPPKDRRIDLSFVETVARTIGHHLKTRAARHTVVVKSTVVPGTTGGLVRAALERESGKTAGNEFGLAMNPEFLREGCAIEDFMNPDRIVVGELDTVSGDDVLALYERFDCPKVRTNLINAELVKYSSNTLLATLVSFSNELYRLCESLPGADGETMMDGLGLDKRLAPTVNGQRVKPGILSYLRGGIGYGGSCLPKDVAALRAWAEERGSKTPLLDAVTRVNEARPLEVVTHVERAAGTLSGKTVAVLGLAFKADTDDLRDSPVLPLVDALLARGAKVRAYDPKAGANAAAHYGSRIVVSTNARDLFAGANVAILGTSWPEFATWDYAALVPTMATRVIVDGRNALRLVTWPAGTKYLPVGRAPS